MPHPCRRCEGTGEVPKGTAMRGGRPIIIYVTCPICKGKRILGAKDGNKEVKK